MLEIVACAFIVTLLSLHALSRMDYLNGATAEYVRMTDASRSALVGRNIAEGRGYTTQDLPANLIDFYDQRGKLHDDEWVNADRFPFTAYATAALYTLTRSTSWEVGILVYNLLCFVGFISLLYYFARELWGERWTPLIAVVLALAHPSTYIYLYLKDADMLLLVTATMLCLYRYFSQEAISKKLSVATGTLLAWLFLARPNLGAPFILFTGIVILRRWWASSKEVGRGPALRQYLGREGLLIGATALWCVPFVIHSMSQWGSPLFSANNIYQLPLGTRFGMGTDTWWKYTEPGHPLTLGVIASEAGGQLLTKFTTSWYATVKSLVENYAIELLLAFGLLSLRSRTEARSGTRTLFWLVGFSLIANLAVLPLYGYQSYSYRHYLGFGMPALWLAAAQAINLLAQRAAPAFRRVFAYLREHVAWVIAAAVAAVVAWNLAAPYNPYGNELFARSATFFASHWLFVLLLLVALALRKQLVRTPWFLRGVVLAFCFLYACYRPDAGIKRNNLIWFPANEHVWDAMRARKGLVSSFALQGEVAWNADRKNIPVPEWPMHIYSFAFDHKLDVEDLYIESADAMLSTRDGPFSWMAPGFEGYARLQRYRDHMPGYSVVFHDETTRSYPRFRVKPHPKASTVYRLTDVAARDAMRKAPTRIELGDERSVIYTPNGWDRYLHVEGKPVAMATAVTRERYPNETEHPWEDTNITFFVDDKNPTSFDLDYYAPAPTSFQFYWNLDLYAYDRESDRKAHLVGTEKADAAGWHHVHFEIPAKLVRRGLNKLGFRADSFHRLALCPAGMLDEACLRMAPAEVVDPDSLKEPRAISVMHLSDVNEVTAADVSMFASTLELHY